LSLTAFFDAAAHPHTQPRDLRTLWCVTHTSRKPSRDTLPPDGLAPPPPPHAGGVGGGGDRVPLVPVFPRARPRGGRRPPLFWRAPPPAVAPHTDPPAPRPIGGGESIRPLVAANRWGGRRWASAQRLPETAKWLRGRSNIGISYASMNNIQWHVFCTHVYGRASGHMCPQKVLETPVSCRTTFWDIPYFKLLSSV